MPGPKMGPRPTDFDEEVIRNSPTFLKWESLGTGETLRYACREFVKGHGEDEERLMRRIMIARRNNIRDHETLKKARRRHKVATGDPEDARRRRAASMFNDKEVEKEMDVAAVEATRSYRTWMAMQDGQEFVYNQKYVKGKEGHDWLLKKNIWRRMRYRRENKKLVERLKVTPATGAPEDDAAGGAQQDLEHHEAKAEHGDPAAVAAAAATDELADQAAVEAAVAAAETFTEQQNVHNPLDHENDDDEVVEDDNNNNNQVADPAALDAAAKLAAAAATEVVGNGNYDASLIEHV